MILFRDPLFVLKSKDDELELKLTLSDLESIWKITEKRNITLHKRIDEFLGLWEQRLRK